MDEERIALLLQRETNYRCCDYIGLSGHLVGEHRRRTTTTDTLLSSPSSSPSFSPYVIDETWRELICGWSYKMVDSYNWSRSIVFVSMNFLDRYVGTGKVKSSLSYQLAALTSFFLAAKINLPNTTKGLGSTGMGNGTSMSTNKLQMSTLVTLSKGKFTKDDFLLMELDILYALEYYLWPPSPLTFIHCFIHVLPVIDDNRDKYHLSLDNATKKEIIQFAQYLSELSCYDYFFVTKDPSLIAMACLLNAMSIVFGHETSLSSSSSSSIPTSASTSTTFTSSNFYTSRLFLAFQREILAVTNIDVLSCVDVQECSSRLEGIYLYNKGQCSCPESELTRTDETESCAYRNTTCSTTEEESQSQEQHLLPSPPTATSTENMHVYQNKSRKKCEETAKDDAFSRTGFLT